MTNSMIFIAGSNGEMVEVEQVDLFKHRINETEFNISVHTDPTAVAAFGRRPLAMSLYETGSRIATLQGGNQAVPQGGWDQSTMIRGQAKCTVEELMAEIGSARLSTLLDNALTEQAHFNA